MGNLILDIKRNELMRNGYSKDQVDEILQGIKAGVDTSVYENPELFSLQMRQIRLGMMSKLDVSLYSSPDFDWLQMEEIRLGLEDGQNCQAYANKNISYLVMREIRKGFNDGYDLSNFKHLDPGILKEVRLAAREKINLGTYVNQGYTPEQLQEIREAISDRLDIQEYITPEFRARSIREIAKGLKEGLDVAVYAKLCYAWNQMQEIRLGMLHRVGYDYYINPFYSWEQMHEIRLGLEAGLDVSKYRSLMYTARQMHEMRNELRAGGGYIARGNFRATSLSEEQEKIFRNLSLNISEDEMQATIIIKGKPVKYKKNDVLDYLNSRGIFKGINEEVLSKLEAGDYKNEEMEIAKGVREEIGQDGYYEYHFDVDAASPKEVGDEGIDVENTNWFETVEKDQKIVSYHRAKRGSDGYTVTGKVLFGKMGKEQSVLSGIGISHDDNADCYYSTYQGKIALGQNRIVVTKILILDEVNSNTEDIDFNGFVYVKGNVDAGKKIKALDDILIEGYVSSAEIESKGNVVLVHGMNALLEGSRGSVKADKGLYAKFLENCSIETGEDLVADYCLNCNINTGGKIILSGSKGSLVGGMTVAIRGITAKQLGNKAQTETLISLGENKKIQKELEEIEAKLEEIQEELNTLKRVYDEYMINFPPEVRNASGMFLKLEKAIYTKRLEKTNMQKDRSNIKAVATRVNDVTAVISEAVYENVTININNEKWKSQKTDGLIIKCVNGHVSINKK